MYIPQGFSCAEDIKIHSEKHFVESRATCENFHQPCPFDNSPSEDLYPECYELSSKVADLKKPKNDKSPLRSLPDYAIIITTISVTLAFILSVMFVVIKCKKFKVCPDITGHPLKLRDTTRFRTDSVKVNCSWSSIADENPNNSYTLESDIRMIPDEHQENFELLKVQDEFMESSDEEDFNEDAKHVLQRFQNAYSNFTLRRLYLGRNHFAEGVIVVVVNENIIDLPESFERYEVICKLWDDNPLESRLAAYSKQAKENPLSSIQSNTLESIILCHNKNLMASHSNLEMISMSPVQSRNNGTEIIVCPCIVLYCTHKHDKGVIPIDESRFPEKLDGVRIDVREGFFYPCPKDGDGFFRSSKVRHEHIRMGCNIGREGTISTGTLGGFFDIGNGDIGLITCAHVLHPSLPISNTDATAQFNVVQPGYGINRENHICGIHLRSVCPSTTENVPDNTTVDASLVKVFPNRKPERGLFAGLSMEDVISMGFTGDYPPEFQSGKIRDLQDPTSKQFRHNACFKIGAASGLTKGLLSCSAASYKHTSQTLTNQINTCIFHKQLEISPTSGQTFAINGDSGAFVYQVETDPQPENEKLVCIGMLTGVNSVGQALVTPIREVLERLGIQDTTEIYSFPKESMEIL